MAEANAVKAMRLYIRVKALAPPNNAVLVEKKGARSLIWKYFGFKGDNKGETIDTKPTWKKCKRSFRRKVETQQTLLSIYSISTQPRPVVATKNSR